MSPSRGNKPPPSPGLERCISYLSFGPRGFRWGDVIPPRPLTRRGGETCLWSRQTCPGLSSAFITSSSKGFFLFESGFKRMQISMVSLISRSLGVSGKFHFCICSIVPVTLRLSGVRFPKLLFLWAGAGHSGSFELFVCIV